MKEIHIHPPRCMSAGFNNAWILFRLNLRLTYIRKYISFLSIGNSIAILTCATLLINVAGNARAGDLAVLTDGTAKIVNTSSNSTCAPSVSLRIEAVKANFFDPPYDNLGNLFGAAIHNLLQRCQSLRQVSVSGIVGKFKVVGATASAADGWKLHLEHPELNKIAASLVAEIKQYSDLGKLEVLFKPFQNVNGIAETSGYTLFAQNSKLIVDSLNRDQSNFDRFAQEQASMPDTKASEKRVEKVLTAVSYYDPKRVPFLRARYAQIAQITAATEFEAAVAKILTKEQSIADAVKGISAQLGKKTVASEIVVAVDVRLSEWINEKLADHEESHPENYLDDLKAHLDLTRSLGASVTDASLPSTLATIETASFWFESLSEEILTANLDEGRNLIDQTGEDYADIDLVLETGIALGEEFTRYGLSYEAEALLGHAMSRVNFLITDGLPEYMRKLAAEPMTREAVAFYREEANTFSELSEDFPGFASYSEAIELGVRQGQLTSCNAQAEKHTRSVNQEVSVSIGISALGIKDLTCALYLNDHLLTELDVTRDGRSGTLTIDTAEDGVVSFQLVSANAPGALIGESATWEDEIGALIVPPPSGKPNAQGVTECDILAGDPTDSAQPSEGVDFESVAENHDFERTIEACIAAVEHDPEATRQVFQLARILDFLGDVDAAAQYAEVAAAKRYAPALHLKAMGILVNRSDDDAFFDAIDLLKEAAALGYQPSRAQLSELVPPGMDLYREIPPPTDKEVFDTAGHNICAGNVFISACSVPTGVQKKNCFQTSENQFSCEIVFFQKCRFDSGIGDDPLVRLFTGVMQQSCPPTTDPVFLRFTKKANGWSYASEF